MTIKQVRVLLGKEAKNLSDEELQRDLEVAELLKNIFFDHLKEKLRKKQNEK